MPLKIKQTLDLAQTPKKYEAIRPVDREGWQEAGKSLDTPLNV